MEIISEIEKDRLNLFHLASLYLDCANVDFIKCERHPDHIRLSVSYENKVSEAKEKIDLSLHFEKERSTVVAMGKAFCRAISRFPKKDVPFGTLVGVRPVKVPLFYMSKGKNEEEITKILEEEYFVSEEKAKLLLKVAKSEKKLSFSKKDVMLYVSVPFCPSRCNYCSFVSVKTEKESGLISSYLSSLFCEIDGMKEVFLENDLNLRGIYVGGGTPGILCEKDLEKLVSKIKTAFSVEDDVEFTFEIGRPDTITKQKLEILHDYKIGRICINPQTTNDRILALIGRKHSAEDYYKAIELAKSFGSFSVNSDLILGLSGDSPEGFLKSLSDVLSLDTESITLHALCLKNASNLDFVPENSGFIDAMNKAENLLINSGFEPYYLYRQKNAVSNLENTGFAKVGNECVYNIAMMEDMVSVLSVGAGASTKIVFGDKKRAIERFYSFKYPAEYVNDDGKIARNLQKITKLIRE